MKSDVEKMKEKWFLLLLQNPKYKHLSEAQIREVVNSLFSLSEILYIVICQENNRRA